MAPFKRRRVSSASSNHQPSYRGQSSRFRSSSSRTSSVPQDGNRSSSMHHPPPKQRISIKSESSHVAAPSSMILDEATSLQDLEDESDVQGREECDSMNEIVMAVELKERGTIGCAYYVAREEKLCMMADISMAGLDMIDTLKVNVEPTGMLW